MTAKVRIGDRWVGDGEPCYIVAEIGINHNGDVDIARQLIATAQRCGCDAVKFQKRTPELCVPAEQCDLMRETPWGIMTYLEYRYRVEFAPGQAIRLVFLGQNESNPWLKRAWVVAGLFAFAAVVCGALWLLRKTAKRQPLA